MMMTERPRIGVLAGNCQLQGVTHKVTKAV